MADIKLTVDASQVKQASNAVKELGNSTVKAAKGQHQALKQVDALQTKSLTQLRRKITSVKRMEKQQKAENHALGANARELDKVRRSTDLVYAQQQKTLQMRKLLRAEVDAGNMSSSKAAKVLGDYRKQLQLTNAVMGKGGKASKNLGMFVQQAGYQVSDFSVQLQGGQNALVAFSQQGSQLAGALPMLAGSLGVSAAKMIALSTGLGIALPLLSAVAGAFFATSKDADTAASSVGELDETIQNIDRTLKNWEKTKKAVAAGVSLDVMASQDKLELAREAEKLAREAVDTATSAGALAGQGAAGGIDLGSMFGFGVDDILKKAQIAHGEALMRLTQLEGTETEKRNKNYLSAMQKRYDDQINMANAMDYGTGSKTYNDTIISQKLVSYKQELALRVEANELDKEQAGRLLKMEESRLTSLETARRRKKIAEEDAVLLGVQTQKEADLYSQNLAYEAKMDTARKTAQQNEERLATVQKARIEAANAAEYKALLTLNQKIKLQGIELKNGKDSEAYRSAMHTIEIDNLKTKHEAAGIDETTTERMISQIEHSRRLNVEIERKRAIVDTTASTYVDILGSSQGLQQSTDVLNNQYQTGLDKLESQKKIMEGMAALGRTYGSKAGGEFGGVPTGLDAFGGKGDYKYDEVISSGQPKDNTKRARERA